MTTGLAYILGVFSACGTLEHNNTAVTLAIRANEKTDWQKHIEQVVSNELGIAASTTTYSLAEGPSTHVRWSNPTLYILLVHCLGEDREKIWQVPQICGSPELEHGYIDGAMATAVAANKDTTFLVLPNEKAFASALEMMHRHNISTSISKEHLTIKVRFNQKDSNRIFVNDEFEARRIYNCHDYGSELVRLETEGNLGFITPGGVVVC